MKTVYYIVIGALLGAIGLAVILKWVIPSTPRLQYDLSRTAVVEQLKKMAQLTTATFTMEKTVEAGTAGSAFKELLFGDKIMLIARGEVAAGFDLAGITAEDIKINGIDLTVNMPPAKILSSRLDNNETKVFDRKLGLFTKGDKDLESNTRAAAEASIVAAACDADILAKATENMESMMKTLFTSLGFSSVTFVVPPSTCGQ